jgi:autotransporter-associated beta strand protein
VDTNGFAVTISQPLLHDTTAGAPAADGGLTKIGSGALTLTASSTYTGATTVSGGTLIVSGSLTGTVSASVSSAGVLEVDGLLNLSATTTVNGTLTGNGSIGAIDVESDGTLAPGFKSTSGSAGNLTANGNVILTDSTSIFSIRLGVARTTDNDQLTMDAGNVTLNNATLELTIGGNYAKQANNFIWVLINGQPAGSIITGEFAQGTSITAQNGNQFEIVYGEDATDTGPGYDVLLVAVPEPGAWKVFVLGVAILAVYRRVLRRKGIVEGRTGGGSDLSTES